MVVYLTVLTSSTGKDADIGYTPSQVTLPRLDCLNLEVGKRHEIQSLTTGVTQGAQS